MDLNHPNYENRYQRNQNYQQNPNFQRLSNINRGQLMYLTIMITPL